MDLYNHIEKKNSESKVLSTALVTKDLGKLSEPPLIKAIRNGQSDIANLILNIDKDILKYDDALCLQDNLGKNILHHAVI